MTDQTQSERSDIQGALDQIADELARAMAKFGAMASPHEAYAVILEELDEFWIEVKSKEPHAADRARDELVQVAAMALRAIADCYGVPLAWCRS